MFYLRQATSATIIAGPYTNSVGAALTGLTLTQSTFMLGKNGAAFVAKNETSNGSHRILGYYSVMLDATDTGSLGRLKIVSSAAAALPIWHDFTVLPSSVFDSLIIGSTLLQINIEQWRGTQPNALSSNRVDATVGALQNTVITSASLADNGVQKMANMLAIDMSSLSATIAPRSTINAFRPLRNRITTSGFLTVYGEDDTTAVWTAALTFNASAAPIVESDPA